MLPLSLNICRWQRNPWLVQLSIKTERWCYVNLYWFYMDFLRIILCLIFNTLNWFLWQTLIRNNGVLWNQKYLHSMISFGNKSDWSDYKWQFQQLVPNNSLLVNIYWCHVFLLSELTKTFRDRKVITVMGYNRTINQFLVQLQ